MSRLTVLLVGFLLVVTGCGTENDSEGVDQSSDQSASQTPSQTPGQSSGESSLSGSWVVTAMEQDGQPRDLAPGTTVTFEFTDERVTVATGCNGLFGTYRYADGTLRIYGLGGTMMGCGGPRMEQEAWLSEQLVKSIEVEPEDGLRLTTDDAAFVLEGAPKVEDTTLAGTTWQLDSLIDGQTVSSVPQGTTASLTLTSDGTLQVDTGCNTGGGSVKVGTATLRVGPLMTTKMACVDPARQQVEAAFTKVLNGTVGYTVEADRLTLTKGDSGLGFTVK
ncbi:META domain-containing protein [Nocardioides sp. Root140]|uniref:META domain-containing protein n=1 Tax=Nocardioides sp. Root140 TaxID=1736460 RepID=UPI0006FADC06|nr:META domain-containing protein [Nocardioides sp. Root140]KQY63834.1 hypothetical protein ASD30_02295 [Nocardioides sp. Root140]